LVTADQLKSEVLRRLRLSLTAEQMILAGAAADDVLTPYVLRNSAKFDGKGTAEKWDREQRKMIVIAVSDLRRTTPAYNVSPESVLWLEREIRRRVK
jgi:hypothetical protein